MKWKQIPLGQLETNCYFLHKGEAGIIIDPGAEGDKLIKIVENLTVKPQAILLTHAHFDHIGAVNTVREYFNIPVYIHENEAKWLLDPSLNGSTFFGLSHLVRAKPADYFFAEEGEHTIGDFTFQLFETPGHSPGSVSYYFENSGIVVVGDALFYNSIGRTDLTGGNQQQLLRSIHEKLLTLPEKTVVLPGHGPSTKIQDEMDSNPFLNGFL